MPTEHATNIQFSHKQETEPLRKDPKQPIPENEKDILNEGDQNQVVNNQDSLENGTYDNDDVTENSEDTDEDTNDAIDTVTVNNDEYSSANDILVDSDNSNGDNGSPL